jgi:hypothetical protein
MFPVRVKTLWLYHAVAVVGGGEDGWNQTRYRRDRTTGHRAEASTMPYQSFPAAANRVNHAHMPICKPPWCPPFQVTTQNSEHVRTVPRKLVAMARVTRSEGSSICHRNNTFGTPSTFRDAQTMTAAQVINDTAPAIRALAGIRDCAANAATYPRR